MGKRIICMGIVVGLLTGCTSIDPYTGEEKTSQAAKGAGIGALAGAVLGAASSSKKDRKKGILTGALIGGGVGAGVGYYMDQQEAVLRQELEGTGVQVQRFGDELHLVMPGNITFASGKSELISAFLPVLDSVAKILVQFDKTVLDVAGYTDSQGSFEMNQALSEQRAAGVSRYLVGQGVGSVRVHSRGLGERDPVASNDTADGRAQNRRVELKIRSEQAG